MDAQRTCTRGSRREKGREPCYISDHTRNVPRCRYARAYMVGPKSVCLTGGYLWQDILFVSLGYQQDGTDSVKLKELLFPAVCKPYG